jgi:hypothetical protein
MIIGVKIKINWNQSLVGLVVIGAAELGKEDHSSYANLF